MSQWQDQALCAQVGGDLWFPEKGERWGGAKQLCLQCPVRIACLEAGIDEEFGIWGGMNMRERRAYRRGQGAAA